MSDTRYKLNRELKEAGFSKDAIDAAWPSWWTDEAEDSPSARAELRMAISRRLGLSPRSLIGERVEFFWENSARFKHLKVHDSNERSAIASFGIALGRDLISATPNLTNLDLTSVSALDLRRSILQKQQYVDLRSLITVCWSFGVPLIQLNIVPLEAKSMHAMVVEFRGRHAILLARKVRYPAMAAFTVAHELGHIVLGHIEGARALVDLEDPAEDRGEDRQEQEADEFALKLLTGVADPIIETDAPGNAPSLASAAIKAATRYGIEPGTIALILAYREGSWARSMSALKFIYGDHPPVSQEINAVARKMLDWDLLSDDSAEYVTQIMADLDA